MEKEEEQKAVTVDMHTHLTEKKVNPKAYWKRVEEISLNAVAITEHADKKPFQAFKALEKIKPEGVLLIPGIEVNTDKGHLLAYSSNEQIYSVERLLEKYVPLEEAIALAKKENLILSFSHPWGYSYDSAAYFLGIENLERLIQKEGIGVETYNGMIGHLSNFLYKSGWVKRPFNFFSFLEKNVVSRKTGVWRIGKKMKEKLDKRRMDLINRCVLAVELGKKAEFITAGSDAHSADRVGTGIMKIGFGFEEFGEEISNEILLKQLKQKQNILWSGPLIKEISPGVFEMSDKSLKRKEMASGIRYATKSIIYRRKFRKKMAKRS